jgi:outer membrane protein assembly factor BamA
MLRFLYHVSWLCFGILIMSAVVAVAQQPTRKISNIQVAGLDRLSADEVIATSGLKLGTAFSETETDAAAQRLIDSGLFVKVGYRTRSSGTQVTVIFQLEERKGGQSPVVFDNFVWFTNEELVAAVRRSVPAFDGSAPNSGTMTDSITLALQNFLNEKQIKGTVEYSPWQTGLNSTKQEHLFSVTGVPIPICSLHFPGAKNIPEETLIKNSKQLTDADFSQKSAIAFGAFVLFPLYREVGQWRAKFATPIAKFENSDSCKAGVNLTIPIEEGAVYLWDKALWTGNQVLPQPTLEEALGMKNGEVLKGSKIDNGLMAVSQAYGSVGHLDTTTRAQPEFDDKANRVILKIDISEGPRYTMGDFIVKGLSETDAEALRQVWKLRRSEVFNTAYWSQFLDNDARDVMRRIIITRQQEGMRPYSIESAVKRNPQALTADAVFEFKN